MAVWFFVNGSGTISNAISTDGIPFDRPVTFKSYCKKKCLEVCFGLIWVLFGWFLKGGEAGRRASLWVLHVTPTPVSEEISFSCCSYILADNVFHFFNKVTLPVTFIFNKYEHLLLVVFLRLIKFKKTVFWGTIPKECITKEYIDWYV